MMQQILRTDFRVSHRQGPEESQWIMISRRRRHTSRCHRDTGPEPEESQRITVSSSRRQSSRCHRDTRPEPEESQRITISSSSRRQSSMCHRDTGPRAREWNRKEHRKLRETETSLLKRTHAQTDLHIYKRLPHWQKTHVNKWAMYTDDVTNDCSESNSQHTP